MKKESKPFKDMLSLTESSLAEFKKNPIPAKREWGEPFVNTMPMIRVEPKKETIEEVAEGYWLNDDSMSADVIRVYISGFVKGAKWQQERSYSEEEVLQLLVRAVTEEYDNLNEWFEQFKKT